MSTVIKARSSAGNTDSVAYNLGDITQHATRVVEQAQAEADKIIEQANASAEAIRVQAEAAGKQAAMDAMQQAIDEKLSEEMRTLLPALDQVIEDLGRAKQDWLAHWQSRSVSLATAIAGKILRRELEKQPEITLDLVREALELAEGSTDLHIYLSTQDMATLGNQAKQLVASATRVAATNISVDPTMPPGGCRIETKRGVIDNSFDAQLTRIEEELR